jgi:hypothetical protein
VEVEAVEEVEVEAVEEAVDSILGDGEIEEMKVQM